MDEKKFHLFESEDEFANMLANSDNFAAIMQKVHDLTVERILRSVPGLVIRLVQEHSYLSGLSEQFYKANEDLVNHKAFVASVANEVAAKNPGWSTEMVFEEAAKESRLRLAMKPSAPSTPNVSKLKEDIKSLL